MMRWIEDRMSEERKVRDGGRWFMYLSSEVACHGGNGGNGAEYSGMREQRHCLLNNE